MGFRMDFHGFPWADLVRVVLVLLGKKAALQQDAGPLCKTTDDPLVIYT